MEKKRQMPSRTGESPEEPDVDLIIRVPEDLYRAYRRCCWVLSHESGRARDECAREMVTDFLVKYGC